MNDVTTLAQAFQRSAQLQPDAVALRTLHGEIEVTWREYSSP